ncbi:hypothetical protein EV359DRAFT_19804, partial [Lentinula novae-zelandiae]
REASAYCNPAHYAAFSNDFFRELTFAQALEVSIPAIAPEGCLLGWIFDVGIPSTKAATVIIPGEIIPHLNDLLPIIRAMESAYVEGKRSVQMHMRVSGQESVRSYHFSKIRLFISVSNNAPSVSAAHRLVDALSAPSTFTLSTELLSRFMHEKLQHQIRGFTATYSLWNLVCLLDGEWLYDDILNCLSELLYFRLAASTKSESSEVPSFMFLSTRFLEDARSVFRCSGSNAAYSPVLLAFRERVKTSEPSCSFGVIAEDAGHYAAYFCDGAAVFQHGDSLHHPPASDICDVLNWVLADIFPPKTVCTGSIALQPGSGQGSGSCGIAAFNFIECRVNECASEWTPVVSPAFRQKMLIDIITYHFIATDAPGVLNDWVATCVPSDTPSSSVDALSGYVDYNLTCPTELHPIHMFISSSIREQKTLTPWVGNLPTMPNHSTKLLGSPISFTSASMASTSPTHIMMPDVFKRKPLEEITRPRKRLRFDSTPPNSRSLFVKSPDRSPSVILVSPPISSRRQVGNQLYPRSPVKREIRSPSIVSISPPTYRKVERSPSITLTSPPKVFKRAKNDHLPQSKLKFDGDQRPHEVPRNTTSVIAGPVAVGSMFPSIGHACRAIFQQEELNGQQWRRGQRKVDTAGNMSRLVLRCNHYGKYKPRHLDHINPSDHRAGRTVKTDCRAHVNLCRHGSLWRITLVDWKHNHGRYIPVGGTASRPPTQNQSEAVSQLTTSNNVKFSRSQIAEVLKAQSIDHPLEPRQISNLINTARRAARSEVALLGGDVSAIIRNLEEKNRTDPGWRYHVKVDQNSVVVALFWQSPLQVELARRYSDVLINDNSYNKVDSQYPLNTGIIIDGRNRSRNVFYCFHRDENTETFNWVFRCYLGDEEVGDLIKPPEVFISDRHSGLIASVEDTLATTFHAYCLHHLEGNVDDNLRLLLGAEWPNFTRDFWTLY